MRKATLPRQFASVSAIFISLSLLVSVYTPLFAAENLIANPGFEEDHSIRPEGWDFYQWGNSSGGLMVEDAHSGGYGASVKIFSTSEPTNNGSRWIFTPVPVTPGQTYTYSNWYKADVPSSVDYIVATSGGDLYGSLGTAEAASDWKQFTAPFVAPSDALTVMIGQLITSVGNLVTDDYSLTLVDEISNENAFTKGMVSLTFDDGWQSVYDHAYPILKSKDMVGTLFVYTDTLVPGKYDGYMSTSTLALFKADGYEIGSHTVLHTDLTATSSSVVKDELEASRDALALSGLGTPFSLAYPYGAYNSAVTTATEEAGYGGARTTDYGYNYTNTDPFALKIQEVKNTTTAEEIQGWIDTATAERAWLILMFHEVVPEVTVDACDGATKASELQWCASTDILNATIEHLSTVGDQVEVVTVMEGLLAMGAELPEEDSTKPILNEVSPIGTTTDTTPEYTFDSTEAGLLTYGGSCTSLSTHAVAGENVITFNTLALGTHSDCTLTVTDASGNVSELLAVTPFVIESEATTKIPSLTLSLSSANPDTSIIKVNEATTTNEVAILVFEIEPTELLEVTAIPVRVTTSNANVSDVIAGAKLSIGTDTFGAYTASQSGTTTVLTFSTGATTLNPGTPTTVKLMVDLKPLVGNYSETETINASITQDEASRIVVYHGGMLKNAAATGDAIGDTHTMQTTGILGEIVAKNGTVRQVDGQDVGEYEIKLDLTAFEGTYYISATTSSIMAYVYEQDGSVTDNVALSTTALESTATREGNSFRISNGDTETFAFKTSFMPTTSGFYRLVLESVTYGATNATPYGKTHRLAPREDFATRYVSLLTTTTSTSTPINTSPTITLMGNGTDVVVLLPGEPYEDEGASATDEEDGDLTDNIVVVHDKPVEDDPETDHYDPYVETYTYTVTDAAGSTTQAVRYVITVPLLSELTVNGAMIDGFTPNTFAYDVVLPVGTTNIPIVEGIVNKDHGGVLIDQSTALPGSATLWTHTYWVTPDGFVWGQEYVVNFTVASSVPAGGNTGGSGGGGGGGGSSRDNDAPRDISVTINNGASTTESHLVNLTFTARDSSGPIEIQISNTDSFASASWTRFSKETSWTLPAGNGVKNVYVRFKDNKGNISKSVSDSIVVSSTGAGVFTPGTTTASTPTPAVLGATTFRFLTELALGVRNNDVSELQKRLKELGFFTYPNITGYYGPVTRDAVLAFQRSRALAQTGTLDQKTRDELNKNTRSPRRSEDLTAEDVKVLVELLITAGIIPANKVELARNAIASL